LGFDAVPGLRPRITSFQRRFASFLEKELLNRLENGEAKPEGLLGLVTKKPSTGVVSIKHSPALRLDPLIGPLEKGVVDFNPRVYTPPALSQAMDPERPDLIVRFPRKSMMKKFRSSTLRRMSTKEINSWPFRITELVRDIEAVEDLSPTPLNYTDQLSSLEDQGVDRDMALSVVDRAFPTASERECTRCDGDCTTHHRCYCNCHFP
jgi:hypothetical protein